MIRECRRMTSRMALSPVLERISFRLVMEQLFEIIREDRDLLVINKPARKAGFQPAGSGGIPAAQGFCRQSCPQNRQPGWLPYDRTVHGKPGPPILNAHGG